MQDEDIDQQKRLSPETLEKIFVHIDEELRQEVDVQEELRKYREKICLQPGFRRVE